MVNDLFCFVDFILRTFLIYYALVIHDCEISVGVRVKKVLGLFNDDGVEFLLITLYKYVKL